MKDQTKPTGPTKTLKTVRVAVKRKQETITSEVFEHELDILRALHLYENVNVTNGDYGELEVPDDAELELRRLQAKYDRKNMAVVTRVYRNPQEMARASGLKVQQARGERAPSAGLRGSLRGSTARAKESAAVA